MSRRSRSSSLLLPLLMLLCALLWLLLGAPLSSADWHAVPMKLRRSMVQLLDRSTDVFALWLPPVEGAQAASADSSEALTLSVYDVEIGTLRVLPLEGYVQGVVAAEMPASYAQDALRCQAVAARTRAVWAARAIGGNGCATHREADLCTDSACCQGYLTPEARKARWQGDFAACSARVDAAVTATEGMILTLNGLPIEMLYHAFSGGRTEAAAAVFAADQPYLISVDSPGEDAYPGAASEQWFSHEDAARLLLSAFPDCGVTAEGLPGQLRVLSRTASGRVDTMLVGSSTVDGTAVRRALALRSTLFTWDSDGATLTFHVRGSGHGVGMSQGGAQAMAAAGTAWPDILAHYYPGADLSHLSPLHEAQRSRAY